MAIPFLTGLSSLWHPIFVYLLIILGFGAYLIILPDTRRMPCQKSRVVLARVYRVGHRMVWGITARLIYELVRMLQT